MFFFSLPFLCNHYSIIFASETASALSSEGRSRSPFFFLLFFFLFPLLSFLVPLPISAAVGADRDFGQCSQLARTARIQHTHRGFSSDASPPFSKTQRTSDDSMFEVERAQQVADLRRKSGAICVSNSNMSVVFSPIGMLDSSNDSLSVALHDTFQCPHPTPAHDTFQNQRESSTLSRTPFEASTNSNSRPVSACRESEKERNGRL